MKLRRIPAIAAALAAAALLLSACAPATSAPASAGSAIAQWADADARTVIDELDRTPVAERLPNVRASIRSDDLILTDETGAEEVKPMPDDAFYLSIAPYVNQTHDCGNHSLTTCRGELANTAVRVIVTDDATGEAVFDEQLTTFDNGFVGVWLPRGITGTVTVESAQGTASAPISTGSGDPTCLTTLRLS